MHTRQRSDLSCNGMASRLLFSRMWMPSVQLEDLVCIVGWAVFDGNIEYDTRGDSRTESTKGGI